MLRDISTRSTRTHHSILCLETKRGAPVSLLFNMLELYLSLQDLPILLDLVLLLRLLYVKPVLIVSLHLIALTYLMLTPFLNILFLHLLLFDLSLKWPRPFLSHGGPSFSLGPLLEFLIPLKLLIPLLYKLTHHIVTVHRRTHHLLLVLTLSRSNYFVFLLELVSIGCNVGEFFLGVVLNVLEVLLHHMLVDILRLVDLLLLIQ